MLNVELVFRSSGSTLIVTLAVLPSTEVPVITVFPTSYVNKLIHAEPLLPSWFTISPVLFWSIFATEGLLDSHLICFPSLSALPAAEASYSVKIELSFPNTTAPLLTLRENFLVDEGTELL